MPSGHAPALMFVSRFPMFTLFRPKDSLPPLSSMKSPFVLLFATLSIFSMSANAQSPASTPSATPASSSWKRPRPYLDNAPKNRLVQENSFLTRAPDLSIPKSFAESRPLLPQPFWEGHQTAIDGYWRAWELAFGNCKAVPEKSGFISPFIDTAFNDCLFMWDSTFILMFARYGERAFPFQQTLDNFYAKQHPSGFISREIKQWDGADRFHYADPNSTGPNLLPWSEWEYFQQFGDRERLAAVFPPLLAYYQWFRKNRSWPDGSYWSTGWANGMDNQPRVSPGVGLTNEHDFMSWIDTTAQSVFAARILVKMAATLGREADVRDLPPEIEHLTRTINDHMWSEKLGFYVDRRRDGSLSEVKSIAGFWPLLAGIVPPERQERLLAQLTNPKTFGRPHPIPTLSADHGWFNAKGGYWNGGVWPSTNYMVLRALTANGSDDLAYTLARRHHDYVTQVFADTGTYWENYSPEHAKPGEPAKDDFVGWGGVGPIAVLLEYVFGLRPDFSRDVLVWDVRLTDAYGVNAYPYGPDTTLDLAVTRRANATDAPVVTIKSNRPVRVELRWPGGGTRTLNVTP